MNSKEPVPSGMKRLFLIGFVVALALVIGGAAWQNLSVAKERQEREAELAKGPKVKVAQVMRAPSERIIKISGEARAYASVTLYAKISGYLKEILVDKGDRVKKGQILATIESPETEQAYKAASSEARNKKAIAERIKSLLDRQLVSQQEADQAIADAEVAGARLSAQEAQKQYQAIRAPFDGTITARFADPGALVQNATNAQTGALPLLSVSQLDQLRVYVYLDQRDVSFVKIGTPVEISLAERPETVLPGHVARIAGQLDEKTRMLLTEVDLDNDHRQIVAGSLVNVSMHLSTDPGLEIPSEALILRGSQTVVAVLNAEDRIDYKEVKVIENTGIKAKLASGLAEGETIALGIGNALLPQTKVRPLKDAPK